MSTIQQEHKNLNDPIDRKSIRDVLQSLRHAEELGKHLFTHLAVVEVERRALDYKETTTGRGLALKRVLLRAMEMLKPTASEVNPKEKQWRPYIIATERYGEGRSPSYVTDYLDIARSTYDHEHADVLDRLVAVLKEWEHQCGSVKSTDANETDSTEKERRRDWREIRDTSSFHGRQTYLAQLTQWVIQDRCRLVGILGMGGVGKTALLEKLVKEIENEFEYIIWRSLRNAPPIEKTLNKFVCFLSNQQSYTPLTDPDELISQLIELLRQHHCLLVLDNVETVMQANKQAGYYREGYEQYGELIHRIGETQHQSCLIVTSREKPREFSRLEGKTAATRMLSLGGLEPAEGQVIFTDKGLCGSQETWRDLVERYSGNPLALQLVSETIREVYTGNISEFLKESTLIFGDIRDLLDQQFLRLSALERDILYWLAIEREAISRENLYDNFAQAPTKSDLLETLHSLRRRCLIEQRSEGFTLQNVILEYVTNRLVQQVYEEIRSEAFDNRYSILASYPLMKAQTKDYVREQQIRIILTPLAKRLVTSLDIDAVEPKLRQILRSLRQKPFGRSGYAGGNILNLLINLEYDLKGYDFSYLTVRQAHLQNVELHEVNFTHAHFVHSVFSDLLNIISAVTVSPNGKFIAAGDASGQLRLWLPINNTPFLTCKAHDDWILSIAFSTNSDMIATGSEDATIKIWTVKTGQLIKTLQGHVGRIRSVVFSPEGLVLASAGDDQTIRLWDIDTGQCFYTLEGHSGWVRAVAFSPDGSTLVSGSDDCSVRIWDVHSGQHIGSLFGHTDHIYSVIYNPNGETIASGGRDPTVRIWNVRTLQCINTLPIDYTKVVNTLAFSPDGQILVIASRTIDLWEVNSGSYVTTLYGHTNRIRGVCFSPDGRILVSGSEDHTVKVWDVQTKRCIKTFHGLTDWITAVAMSPDGYTIASASYRHIIKLWNIDEKQSPKSLKGHSGWISSIAFSPDGILLASGSEDYTVKVWNMKDNQCIRTLPGHRRRIRSVIFSPDGILLASGGSDRTIRLWQVSTGQCQAILTGHTDAVMSVAFRPNSKALASSSYDRTIKLWGIGTGQCIHTFHGHSDWIRSIAFSPDGHILASGSDDHTVRLWDVDAGQCLKIMANHSDRVRAVAFSPHGSILASGSEDHTVKLWNISTGHCFLDLRGHTNHVSCLVFSPDGQTIISGSDDETIKIWSIATGECLSTLHNERLYERMNITGATGLIEAQKTSLKLLGAIEI